MSNEVSSKSSLHTLPIFRNVGISRGSILIAADGSIYRLPADAIHGLVRALDHAAGNLSCIVRKMSDAWRCLSDKASLHRRSILIIGGAVIVTGVVICLYTGYNPLAPIIGWLRRPLTSSLGLGEGIRESTNSGGTAYGILLKGNSSIQLEGTNTIDIAGFASSYGLVAEGGSTIGMGTGSNTQIVIDRNPVFG